METTYELLTDNGWVKLEASSDASAIAEANDWANPHYIVAIRESDGQRYTLYLDGNCEIR